MNIGEKIQFYRKKFQMSQEELGQRLLVSRQTVSLWEKNQTVPSIDNLIRLKEIFGVSLDNLLDCENDAVGGDTPREKEYYRFTFSEKELKQISNKTKTTYNIRFIIATVCYLFISFCAFGSDDPDFLLGLLLGFYVITCMLHLRVRKMNKTADKKSRPRVHKSSKNGQ